MFVMTAQVVQIVLQLAVFLYTCRRAIAKRAGRGMWAVMSIAFFLMAVRRFTALAAADHISLTWEFMDRLGLPFVITVCLAVAVIGLGRRADVEEAERLEAAKALAALQAKAEVANAALCKKAQEINDMSDGGEGLKA